MFFLRKNTIAPLLSVIAMLATGASVQSKIIPDYMVGVDDPSKRSSEEHAVNFEKLCRENPTTVYRIGAKSTCAEIFNPTYEEMTDDKLHDLFVAKIVHNTPDLFAAWINDFKNKAQIKFESFKKRMGDTYRYDSAHSTPRQEANEKIIFGQ